MVSVCDTVGVSVEPLLGGLVSVCGAVGVSIEPLVSFVVDTARPSPLQDGDTSWCDFPLCRECWLFRL